MVLAMKPHRSVSETTSPASCPPVVDAAAAASFAGSYQNPCSFAVAADAVVPVIEIAPGLFDLTSTKA